MSKFKVGQKAPLVEDLLIIEGITRSGKFLLANILNGLEDIEPVQYSGLLEQIPFLSSFGLIEKETARQLIRCEVDMRAYEMLIGRNLNQRLSDKSSIYNIPNYQRFLDRTKGPEGIVLLKDFQKNKIYSPFILHESMANIAIYFETFPNAKCIALQRNPLDLAYSWYKRGLGKRWGTDPLLFQIPFTKHTENGVFPWFAAGWEDLYLKSSEVDRAILSIISLVKKSQERYSSLPASIKGKILVISFEDLMLNPNNHVKKISTFLGKKPALGMKQILKCEGLPSKAQKIETIKKVQELRAISTKDYLEELLKLPSNYLKF